MARRPRTEYPGSIHHVTARGIGRRALFADDADRSAFLSLLGTEVVEQGWTCHSYCLMGNHYHLVVRVGDSGLARGMYRLNGLFSQRYNRTYGVGGHVLDKRFANQLVGHHEHLLELVRYVHLNPVRAGLCRLPDGWRWSSYRAIAGLEPPLGGLAPEETLGLFGRDPEVARGAFARFVVAGIAIPPPARPADAGRPGLLDLVRTLGLEGARLAVEMYGYTREDVASALGVHPRTLRRHLQALSGSGPGPEPDIPGR